MTTDSVPVVVAYVNGQLLACHEAIAEIWHTFDDVNAGVKAPGELIETIQKAVKLLPEDMREERRLTGRTYWYHPESDSHFALEHGAEHPAYRGDADGAMCVQISKAEYEAVTKSAGDDFEDLLG